MKYLFLPFFFLLGVGPLFIQSDLLADENEAFWEKVDAVQAMEIANKWKWTQKEIKSHVTSRDVVFKFSNGTTKKIPLPRDKMLVAVAPYINRTHQ